MPAWIQALRLVTGLAALVAVLWLVLRAGGALQAPPNLAGAWHVTGPEGCVATSPQMRIDQSGVFLAVSWPDGPVEQLRGRLSGASFTASGLSPSCGSGPVTLEGEWISSGMRGQLSAPGCVRCPAGELRALPERAP